ncbi:MAG: hypothetical protein ABI947_19340 [Chloroflexota bacterium]
MSKRRIFTIQHTAYFSTEMWALLQQLANHRGNGCTENDLIREAVRGLIDNESGIIGSRRHFQKSLQERVEALETTLSMASEQSTHLIVFYLNIIIQLLAFGLAHLISLLSKHQISPQQLIQRAVIEARKEERVFAEQVQAVRAMDIPEKSS